MMPVNDLNVQSEGSNVQRKQMKTLSDIWIEIAQLDLNFWYNARMNIQFLLQIDI